MNWFSKLEAPLDVPWWQWLIATLVVAAAFVAGRLLGWATKALLVLIAKRARIDWLELLIKRLAPQIGFAWAFLLLRIALSVSAPPEALRGPLLSALRIGFFILVFWSLWRAVDVAAQAIGNARFALERPSSRALIPLGARVAKVFVFGIGIVAVLSALGYPVASLVAGLGIGGLALALAAQKTVENLFGAFSIGVDQPFREGDLIKVDDVVGVVEAIGLRSTRIRTPERSLVTLPNGKLAEMRVESLAARDRMRFFCALGLVYGTTPETLETLIVELENILKNHPKIWPDGISVRLVRFGQSSLDLEAMAGVRTSDGDEFSRIRQEILLAFMRAVKAAGTDFAFPTQTVHLRQAP